MQKMLALALNVGSLKKMAPPLAGLLINTWATAAPTPQAAQEARVDAVFAQWDRNDSPGCQAFAFQNGNIILNKSYGMADLEWSQPIGADTVFYLASTSKQFTAASIALLVLDGKLNLEDDVRQYIPELPDFGTPIKVKHLVYHTSGLRDVFGLKTIRGDMLIGATTNDEVVKLMSKQQDLNFKPGTQWSYSNSGYVLMSVLIERVSGMTLAQFARQRLFEPLGMTHTQFDDDHKTIVPKRARSYVKGETGEWLRWPKVIDATGDGNLLSTVSDLLRWDENFYNSIVGGQGFVELMYRGGTQDLMDKGQYAFGLSVDETYRGLKTVHHGGAFMGFRIQLLRFPEQHFTSGVLCNAGNANSTALSYQIADIYLANALGPAEEAVAENTAPDEEKLPTYQPVAGELQPYIGTYRSPELDVEIQIVPNGDTLHFAGPGKFNGDLTPTGDGKFAMDMWFDADLKLPVKINAQKNADGTVKDLLINTIRINNFRMEKCR